jgi:hypothetical protein
MESDTDFKAKNMAIDTAANSLRLKIDPGFPP